MTRNEIISNLITYATVVVIFEPPADPAMKMASLYLSNKMTGHIDESGRLLGLMKFAGDGASPKLLFFPGDEKSSISSFNIMPVLFERIPLPNLRTFG